MTLSAFSSSWEIEKEILKKFDFTVIWTYFSVTKRHVDVWYNLKYWNFLNWIIFELSKPLFRLLDFLNAFALKDFFANFLDSVMLNCKFHGCSLNFLSSIAFLVQLFDLFPSYYLINSLINDSASLVFLCYLHFCAVINNCIFDLCFWLVKKKKRKGFQLKELAKITRRW